MAEQILMTALSPTMEEGTLVAWKKKEGDTINSGDVLCEVETDKATMDYEATQEGVLLKIVLVEGKSARVGEVIGIVGETGESFDDLIPKDGGDKKDKPDEEHERDQSSQDKQTTGRDSGEKMAGTDKSTSAPTSKDGDTDADRSKAGGAQKGTSGIIKASPLARKIAQMKDIDLSDVTGSGPDGRVVKRDVEEFKPSVSGAAGPAAAQPGRDQTIPVSGRRAVIAKRLAESKFQAPHYYVKVSVNMESVITARSTLNRELPQKAGFNAFIVKFVAEALKRHPEINSSWQGDKIIQFGSIDIGLAVDAGNGLITPIIRNCGNRGVIDIDNELKVLIEKAQNNSLKPEEYTGATFTISNLGSFGVEEFTAIINPPGAAILAVGETRKTPVVNEADEVVVRPIMKLSLSSDHRVIDGAMAARFMNELKLMMESPARVLF